MSERLPRYFIYKTGRSMRVSRALCSDWSDSCWNVSVQLEREKSVWKPSKRRGFYAAPFNRWMPFCFGACFDVAFDYFLKELRRAACTSQGTDETLKIALDGIQLTRGRPCEAGLFCLIRTCILLIFHASGTFRVLTAANPLIVVLHLLRGLLNLKQ